MVCVQCKCCLFCFDFFLQQVNCTVHPSNVKLTHFLGFKDQCLKFLKGKLIKECVQCNVPFAHCNPQTFRLNDIESVLHKSQTISGIVRDCVNFY